MSEKEKLRNLEERLLDPDIRQSSAEVGKLLADEFVEFGSSGTIYDKRSIIADLKQNPGNDKPFTISNFKAHELSPTVALVTYRIVETNTLRSSIWRRKNDAWEMLFHQGTRAEPV